MTDCKKKKEAYRKTDGFRLRLNSAIIAARFLARVRPDAGEYMDQAKQFENELEQISAEGIW
ncbi:MAG: hypothetical protein ACYSOZ_08030 [Planctomycetota bacterium]